MEHCIKIGVFGANKKGSLGKVKKGDKIVCYVTKDCKIIGTGEATSDYYMDDEPKFRADGVYPDRFNFKVKQFKREEEIDIKSIVDDLSLVTNKAYWSVFFRMSCRQLPGSDYKYITQLTSKK
jgi:predicted RNA-binding protein